ncbi:MAG: hypothetical protein ACQEV7_11630 [Bacillota bacterium]
MSFADILRQYIGRELEVYLTNQFLEGTLLSVENTYFVLEVRNGSYIEPIEIVNVYYGNVEGIRVLIGVVA